MLIYIKTRAEIGAIPTPGGCPYIAGDMLKYMGKVHSVGTPLKDDEGNCQLDIAGTNRWRHPSWFIVIPGTVISKT